jgi:uncharacterized protein YjbI with pentapeptide repeats
MTVRDWLQLLIVPFALVVIGFLFTMQQDARQQQIEDRRAQQAQEIENRRAEAERDLAEQRAQDEALQAYLDQMNNLLLEHNLRNSKEDSGVRTLARARTLTVLGRLDPSRKTAIMQFLVEARLVQGGGGGRGPIIPLADANLSGVDLNFASLRHADLSHADLSHADLSDAVLYEAVLYEAVLRGAYLNEAHLYKADLSHADLRNAWLTAANLDGASGVTKEELEQQALFLEGTIMPDGTIYPGIPAATIYPGRYVTREFEPPFSFELGESWQGTAPDTTDGVFIEAEPEGDQQLFFTNPLHVFDPTSVSEPKELSAPEKAEEWVSWFQSHPNLDTSKPIPVSVGGASGMRIDVTPASTPEDYPRDFCGERPCIPLYPSGETTILSYEKFKDRFVIVDVGGETVIIDVGTQADRFDEFLPKVQKVLDTVEWKGG